MTVTKQTNLSLEETFTKVKDMLESDDELKKIDPNIYFNFNESNKTGSANSNQFKADLKVVNAGSGSEVEIVVDLPFHLGLVKGLVKSTLQKKLDHSLS
ncbi:MAG: hypothetical protein KDD50_05745 [Bdellovibrionales bacterium]|nr:hypothetical protein [Bdellovibrionales bacterium]